MRIDIDGFLDENDAKLLDTVSKDEVVSLFNTRVHQSSPTRRKLSVHMISQKTRPKRVSPKAASVFEASVLQKLPALEFKDWKSELDETPLLQDFSAFWEGELGDSPESQDLLKTLPSLVEAHPLPGERQHYSKPGATYIQDTKEFKTSLSPSTDPGPIVDWGDLPSPRL